MTVHQKLSFLVEKNIDSFLNSVGTQNHKLHGTNEFTPLFSKKSLGTNWMFIWFLFVGCFTDLIFTVETKRLLKFLGLFCIRDLFPMCLPLRSLLCGIRHYSVDIALQRDSNLGPPPKNEPNTTQISGWGHLTVKINGKNKLPSGPPESHRCPMKFAFM